MFYNSLPVLDLHGENREISRILVNEFINDNLKLKNDKVVIIHGIGSGVIRKEVLETLKKNKNVLNYKTDFMNPGCTIVELKSIY